MQINFQRTLDFDTNNTVLLNLGEHLLSLDNGALQDTLDQLHVAVEHDKNVIINCADFESLPDKQKSPAMTRKALYTIISSLITPHLNDKLNKHMTLHLVNVPERLTRVLEALNTTVDYKPGDEED